MPSQIWRLSILSLVICTLFDHERTFAQGVLDRQRPDYDPIGLPVGAFQLFPSVALDAGHDNNVYRTQNNARGDGIFEFAPNVTLKSNWSQHMLNFEAGLQHYLYSSLSSEDHTDWNVGTTTRLDVLRGTAFTAEASYVATHESRTSPDQPGSAATPTPYVSEHAQTGLSYAPFRIGLDLGLIFDRYSYEFTSLVNGSKLDNSDRNRDAWQLFAKARYEFSPGYAAFLRAAYDGRVFDQKIDRTGVDRSSNGTRLDSGLDLDITRLVHGDIFVGYLDQKYHAPLIDVSGIDYGLTLDWYLTPLVTLHVTASRILNDTVLTSASTSDDQRVGTSFDYELLRNLIIQGTLDHTASNFLGSPRRDTYSDASISFNYLVNRYLAASAKYIFSERQSNIAGAGYSDSIVSARLTAHL